MDNIMIAKALLNMAHTLEQKQTNLYRVRAYRRAAQTICGLEREVKDILAEEGPHGLEALPGIGTKLSTKIDALVHAGNFPIVKEREETTLVAV